MHYTQPDVYEFISKQTNDPIVERKACRISGTKFPIYQSDLEFYDKISPTFAGETFQVPTPSLCPEERARRRQAWRNERSLYRRKCHATQKDIISMYKPNEEVVVYDNDVWWSDGWDALSYGRIFDDTKGFNKQFHELLKQVPKMARVQQGENPNAMYTNTASYNKDCYLIFNASNNEHCLYGSIVDYSHWCIDGYGILRSEQVYDSVLCAQSCRLFHCEEIDDSSDMWRSTACVNCNFCYGCIGLVNKSYHVLNKPVSKEVFHDLLQNEDKQKRVQQDYVKLCQTHPRSLDLIRCEEVSGNHLLDTKSTHFTWIGVDCEDCKYCDVIRNIKNSYDVSYYGVNGTNELLYECEGAGHGVYHCMFCKLCWGGSRNLLYCYECFHCEDCFACVGLRDKKYCVFNKQYSSKEVYDLEVKRILRCINEQDEHVRGNFFSPEICLFGYNETLAQELYPLVAGHEKLIAGGYIWSNYEYHINIPEQAPRIYPNDFDEIARSALRDTDEILHQIIICMHTGKPFRIVSDELAFYRKHSIILPKLHPDVRHQQKIASRPQRNLYVRSCDKSNKKILSVYAEDESFPVYSQEVFEQFMYG